MNIKKKTDDELDQDDDLDTGDTGDDDDDDETKKARSGKSSDDDDEYSLDDVDEDDDDEEEKPRKNRQDKKRERGELHAAREEERRQFQEMSTRIARAEGAIAAGNRPATQTDPIDSQITEKEGDLQLVLDHWNAISKTATAEQADRLRARAKKIEDEIDELKYQKRDRARRPQQGQQNNIIESIKRLHPDVYMPGNERVVAWADARYKMRISEGAPANLETVNAVMEEARSKHGLASRGGGATPRRQPTSGDKARLSGVPRGSGGGSSGEGAAKFKMTDAHKGMADVRFKHIRDPKKRYDTYFKQVIVPMHKKKQANRGKDA